MFHDSSMSAGFYNGNETNTPTKAKGGTQNRMQSVVPVCIRQLISCTGDDFTIFGMRAQIVSIVGILREFEVSTIKATYTIEDHTGSIKAVLWLDSDANETVSNLPEVKEGRYLKIFGSVRVNDNEKTLHALKMHPVEDPNVITTHLLDVIHTRYSAEKLQKDTGHIQSMNNPSAALANTMNHIYEDQNQDSSFTPIQQKVINIFKANDAPNGMHLNALLANFQPNQHSDVQRAIDFLQAEGHIYSTIDPNHFKSTD